MEGIPGCGSSNPLGGPGGLCLRSLAGCPVVSVRPSRQARRIWPLCPWRVSWRMFWCSGRVGPSAGPLGCLFADDETF